ncbi:MAG TPA: preprotein translocase subunit YajC [Phycisphaerales bacterium]
MQTASLNGFEFVLTLAQADTPAAQAPLQAPAQAAPASNQALVPIGIPTAAKTAATESQPLAPNTVPAGPTGAPRGMDMTFLFIMVGFLLLMIFMTWSGSRKEKKKREELNSALGKGDTVQTIGGIIGEIVELGDKDVVLRSVDGRIRFARSAIQGILKSKGDKSDARADATVEPKLAATANAR